jgi:hypothetical protein
VGQNVGDWWLQTNFSIQDLEVSIYGGIKTDLNRIYQHLERISKEAIIIRLRKIEIKIYKFRQSAKS